VRRKKRMGAPSTLEKRSLCSFVAALLDQKQKSESRQSSSMMKAITKPMYTRM
jgi:hypothetical protein